MNVGLFLMTALLAQSDDGPSSQWTIIARESKPMGKIFRGSLPVKVEWDDLYPVGFGAGVEGKGTFAYGPGRAGFYGSLVADYYSFDTGFDKFGSDLKIDPLVTVTLSGGPVYELNFGKGFFWNFRGGLEVVIYPGADAHSSGASAAFIDTSANVGAEAGTRLGWGNRSISIEAGVNYRYQGGREVDNAHYKNLSIFSIEVGVGFRF